MPEPEFDPEENDLETDTEKDDPEDFEDLETDTEEEDPDDSETNTEEDNLVDPADPDSEDPEDEDLEGEEKDFEEPEEPEENGQKPPVKSDFDPMTLWAVDELKERVKKQREQIIFDSDFEEVEKIKDPESSIESINEIGDVNLIFS